MIRLRAALPLLLLVPFVLLASPAPGHAAKPAKPKKPTLKLSALPRMSLSPALVLVSAELRGGDESEEFDCLHVEWDWDDGGRSLREPECAPWEPGSRIERQFSMEHLFQSAGTYRVEVKFLREGKLILAETVQVIVRAGSGDSSEF